MSTSLPIAFAKGASAYKAYLESPQGCLRLELTWHQLLGFMGKRWGADRGPLQVLDVGCGTGEVALRLVALGHAVTLLDPVEEMLRFAKERAEVLPSPPAIPPRFLQGSLEEASDLLEKKSFDLLLCHTLLEYLPNPESALLRLRHLLSPGGFLSLVALNRWQESLRLALRDGKFDEARMALHVEAPIDSLFGLPRKGMAKDELQAQLEAAGIDIVASQGILVFSDYLSGATLEDPSVFTALLRLEIEAGGLSPLREVARYLHLWGRRALDGD